jgi:hypothetical protein
MAETGRTLARQLDTIPDSQLVGGGFLVCRNVTGCEEFAQLAAEAAADSLSPNYPEPVPDGCHIARLELFSSATLENFMEHTAGGFMAVSDDRLRATLELVVEKVAGLGESIEAILGGPGTVRAYRLMRP